MGDVFSHLIVSCSDERLTLETSAYESLYGGQFTLSTQLTKPNYLGIQKAQI